MTFTALTRTIAGAILDIPFDTDDEGNSVEFRMAGANYTGEIGTFVSASSVILVTGAGLPVTDGTITEFFASDLHWT